MNNLTFLLLSFILLFVTIKIDNIHGYQSTYKKPIPSNGPCIDSIERMEKKSSESNVVCLGCYDASQTTCPSDENINCQKLIDDIYRNCDKVNLPWRFYYDPPGKRIQGYWNDEITQGKLKEATRRCGCNSSFGIMPPTIINILVALVGYALWI